MNLCGYLRLLLHVSVCFMIVKFPILCEKSFIIYLAL